jgi:ferredoxin
MSHRITEECIVCGVCQAECPEEAIRDGGDSYLIDPDRCSDCGACAEVCPVGACVPEQPSGLGGCIDSPLALSYREEKDNTGGRGSWRSTPRK